ncbi:filamentous hemagglutinin [Duganella sp. CF458]|uniref:hemagglutinin repeat-containing protein n=1 Tax=Duganella sp. CF458 TaxID=1884368 RepID=UPI0008DF09E9|nr:hemagglutinin repeat-containing protein [Duganella sp. CF458]SFG82775.1 filamentous hemagglutinin [Duganella sp. CF458]
MNKQIYRLVFNQARGCLMVVAETATSSGKSASGERVSRSAKKQGGQRGRAALAACESIHRAMLLSAASLWLAPMHVDAQTVATRIVADPAAARAQQATVLNASNGVTQVNIQTPSKAGVSRNTYSQFDVGATGAILNNSRNNVQTQLGGWVQGNPWLAAGTARVILNEVNSSNPSQLQGYVEVAGQRAEVVVANPAGIAVNGGGFINASGVTLTTGTAVMNNGSLESYRVQGGNISIDGGGLDTRGADYTAVLARAAQVNAGIWANRLQVVTGSNSIQAGSLGADSAPQAQRIDGDANVPNFALDVSSLGGMYAGKITLIGTEAGLGVRNDGVVQASSGPLTLTQDGWLANSGTLQASGGDLKAQVQGTINQSGIVYGSANVLMASQGDQTHSGTVAAQGDVRIEASGAGAAIQANGNTVWAAGLQMDGSLTGQQNLDVQAASQVQMAGKALATRNLAVQGASLDLSQSGLQANSIQLHANSGGLNARGSQILAADTLQLQTPQALASDGALVQANTLSAQAQSLSNVRGQIIQTGNTDQSIALQGKLDNTAGVIQSAGHNLAVSAQDIDNTAGQLLHAGKGTFKLGSDGQLKNNAQSATQLALADGARIVGSGAVQVQAGTFSNTGSINAAGDLNTNAATLDNLGVMYAAGAQTLSVTYGMANRGTVAAAKDLTLNAASFAGNGPNLLAAGMAADGRLTGIGALTANTTGALQSSGQLLATGNLNLSAASLDLTGSSAGSTSGNVNLAAQGGNILTRNAEVSTPGQLTISANANAAQVLDNTGGQLSGRQLQVRVGQLDNTLGSIQQTGTGSQVASIQSTGALNNASGRIVGNAQDFGITAGGALSNADGLVSAIGNLAITSGDLSNAGAGTGKGVQSQTGNIVLNVQALDNSGGIYAAKNLDTTAAAVSNSGTLYAGGQQRLAVRAALATSGTIAAAKDLTINAASVAGSASSVLAASMSTGGELTGSGNVAITTTGVLQNAGQLLATGNVVLDGSALDLSGSTTGSTAGQLRFTAQSGNVLTRSAQVSTPGQLVITANQNGAQALDNTAGRISAAKLEFDVRNIDNSQGSIQQTGNTDLAIDLHGGAFNNSAGSLVANASNLSLNTGALTNTAGEIGHSGAGQLSLSATSIENTRGQIVGNGTVSLSNTGNLTNADGLISAAGDLTATSKDVANTASGAATTATGILSQAGNVNLDVQNLTNSGSIRSGQDLGIHAASLDNSGTMYATGAQALTVANAIATNGTIAAGKDLTVNAGSLAGAAGNVLAAGMAADGQLTGTGALSVTASGALQTAGQALATGDVNLAGASVDLGGSTTGSTTGDVHLTAQSGNVVTSHAKVSTPGQLTINANGNASQLLDNTGGQLSSQQLQIKVGHLDNSQGSIQQTGTGGQPASIQSTGALNNTGGRIVANAQDFTLSSGALTNNDGLIGHAGTGSLGMTAASVANNRGQITGNGAVTLTSAGNVDNSAGLIAAQNDLTLGGADLTNTSGANAGIQSQAGSVSLDVQNLANSGSVSAGQSLNTHAASLNNSGTMYAAGSQTVAVVNGMSTSGAIAAGKDLTVNAGSLSGTGTNVLAAGMAADGQLTGNAALAVSTTGGLQTAGQALAAGNVNLRGGNLNLSGGTTGSTKGDVNLTATSGNVLTRNAKVSAPGQLNITANANGGQLLDNTAGQLSGQQLRIKVGQLDNSQGAIQQTGSGAQAASIQSTGALNNSSGQIVANAQDFTVSSGALTNTSGLIGHAGTGSLGITAAGIGNNNGQITGNGAVTLTSSGNVDSSAGLIASQNDLVLNGADLTNTSGANAGIQSQLGNVSLNVQNFTNSGNVRAAQNLDTHAASLNNSGTMYAVGWQTVTVGNVLNSSGTIAAGKDLTVNAGSLAGTGANVLAAGMAGDGKLAATGALNISTTGALKAAGQMLAAGNLNLAGSSVDLSGSTTGSTNGNVSLSAQSGNVLTRQAKVSTPGQLTITARNNGGQLLDNSSGQLSAQQLQIQVGRMDNTQGVIQQSGTGAQGANIQSLGAINNNAGRIVANAQDFTLSASGALSNVDGLIGHAGTGSLNVSANGVDNTRGQVVGNGATTVSSSGFVDNSSGLVSAQQNLTIGAAGVDNDQGKLVAMQGSLSLHSTQGSINNAAGLIQAAQDLGVTAAGAGNSVQNAQGKIIAGRDANLSTGSMGNDAGLIASGRDLHVDTHGQALSNLDGTVTPGGALGLVAGGQMTINSGALDNRAGLISAQTGLDIASSGAVNNASRNGHAGQIYSGANLKVQATGLDNTAGQVLAVQGANIDLGAGTLGNSAGLVRVGQTLTLKTGAIDNTSTKGANAGIEATTIDIVTASLNNTQGAVRAGQDLTIRDDGQLNNNQGELSAGRALQITTNQAATPSLALSNAGGQIIADQSVSVRTGSLNGAGSIVSKGDVGLDLQGDYTLSGTLQAGGNLQLKTTGSLTNPISVQAGRSLTVNAANLDNRAGAELLSGETTTVGVGGTLTNRGLIDGADTHLQASQVNNLGTGRIYGDRVAIGASVVNNLDEAGSAATIAGRQRVDIGTQYLTNREGSLIFSAGDMSIGGALDGNWQAAGMAQTVNNNSATIEASQNLAISASEIRNTNEHFATAVQQVSQVYVTEYQVKGQTQRYLKGTPGVYTYLDESLHLHTPDGNFEEWSNYDYTRTVNETVVTQSDPGKIIAGGGIRLIANNVLNDKSQIVAGGRIDVQGTTATNTKVDGNRTTTDAGTVTENWRDKHKGADSPGSKTTAYNPGSVFATFDMQTSRYEEFAGNASTGSGPGASGLSTVQAKANGGGTVNASNQTAGLSNVSGTQAGSASGAATASQTGSHVQNNNASATQAQGGTIAGNTGKQITGDAASSEQAHGDAIGNNVGRHIIGGAENSDQAIGQATTQQTDGQVQSLSGASAKSGKTPDTAGTATGSAQISIRTMRPNFRLPTASLFKTHPESQAKYLIETDPKFTNYKSWLSSDYMLDALQVDPATTQKRMGDGFYEQKLIREQVLALTGKRFLGDYTNDDEEYKALMDNGLTYAKQWGLRPGVSLSPEQVSQLTSDIVWLVTQDVQLPDGSTQSVLVPQVYVRVQPGDLDGSGALMAGKEVNINLTGDFANSGTVAGRNLVNISADNIRNMGGTMSAGTLALQATKDIDNVGGTLKAQNAALLSAGRDLNLTTTTQSSSNTVGANSFAQTGIDRVAGLYVSGPAGVLLASAGNNINLTAAQISNAGTGVTQLSAGNNLNLSAVNTSISQRVVWDADNRQSQSASMDVGSQVKGAGNLVLNAGQDINAKAAVVSAGQTLNVAAGRDVNITAGQVTQSLDEAHKHTSKGFLSKKTVTTHDQLENATAIGSSLEGSNVNVLAGRDLTVKGSSIIADQNLSIDAARNLSVLSVEDTSKTANSMAVKKSGLTGGYASGNLSVGYGKSTSSTNSDNASVTQHESTIGALNGSAKLKSGETLQVVASDIAAKENLTLIGKNVDLSAAQNTSDGHLTASSKSSGFSVGVTVNPIAAAKDAYKESTKNSKSSGTIGKITSKGDGVADGLWAATTAVTVQFGSKSSTSNQNQSTSEARTTSLNAGKDLTILATDGSINSQGTQMSAEGNAMIVAKDSIKFDVAHNTETKSQDSKSSGFSFDNRSAVMAGTFNNKGKGNGTTDTVTGTKLSVGGNATMATQTGDIALIGANVVSDGKMEISAARDLTITSAQDTVQNANQSDNKAIGRVVISDTERFVGYHNEKHKDNTDQVKQVASNVASLKGDVMLSAGEKYTQASSNVLAANNVDITAKSIDITALQDTGSSQTSNSDLKVGAFARISSPLIDLVNNVEAARKSDGRLQTMQGMAAAAQGYQAAKAVASKGTLIKGEVGIGFASSSNSSNDNNSTAVGSTINGGNNVTLTSTAGDIHATGATLGAGKTLSLDSAQNIVLDASQSKLHSDGKNNSAGVEVGVGFQAGASGTGVYAYAAANVGKGHHNNDATINNNTQLKADTINITSKGDTTLKGATATANTINADVGGKLAIESLQDVSKEESSQTNAGARVQVSFGTAWEASGNLSQSKSNGSSAAVGQQSGLFAGDGGYHVKADTVDLKGGAIASTNKVDSELATNKLTTANIENKMSYSASNVSMAGSIGGGSGEGDKNADGTAKPKDQQQLFGDRKSGNVTPGVPTMEKGSDSSTTYATITDGKINIGGVTATSVKELGINNDASKANTALDKLPDLQKVLKDQQAMSAAAGTVLATGKQLVGEFANNMANSANTKLVDAANVLTDEHSSTEQKAAAAKAFDDAKQSRADWGPGGIYSSALNAGVTVAVGSLAGQSNGQIAADALGPIAAKSVGDIGTSLAKKAEKEAQDYKDQAAKAAANNDLVAAAELTEKAKAAAATAENWGDNGIYRVGLHAATQGMLGSLANGHAGALENAAGVVGGNLGQQLGAELGKAEAKRLGLDDEKSAALINAYQNTGAVLGGMVAGAVAAGASGNAPDGGALLAAAQGSNSAKTVDDFNRQLHPKEVAFLQDKARVKRYADYIKGKTGTTLTEEQAQLALSRYGAAMEDEKWAQVNGRDGNTEAFIKQEAIAAQLSYTDSAGNKHVGFQATAAEYKDETINLRALFDAYSPGNSIATYLGANLNSKGQTNAAQRFRQGQQLGYQDAGKEANLANDTWDVAKGILSLPIHAYQSLTSDEIGPFDSERMKAYHQSLLKTQGRYEEAGYLYEKDWATSQRLMVVGLPLTELGGAAIWRIGSATKTLIVERGAAKEAAQAIEKARVENNRRRDDDQQYVNNTAPKDVPEVVTRNDNDFTATVNHKGNPKAHVDANGNLISANPGGTGTVADHVRGSNPKNTPYISTTDPTLTDAPKDFGKQQIEINARDLQRDINSGDVQSGKVVSPQKVQAELQEKVDQAQARYDANPTEKNEKRLREATRDLGNAKRDGECLVSPCVPAPYIKWPNGVAPKPNVPTPPPAKH